VNDLLLRLFSADISAAGVVTQQAGVFAGRNRTFNAVPRIGGDVTGTTPTLSFTLEESNALASGYAQVPGTGTINVTEMWGLQAAGGAAAAGAKPEIPRVPGTPPRVAFATTKDYVRAVVTAGGTSPVFPKATIYLEPTDATSKISGS
jgi:hypothetical protein